MKQGDLHRAVARALGETVSTIRQRGFTPASLSCLEDRVIEIDGLGPHILDWDSLEACPRDVAVWCPGDEAAAV